MKIVLIKAFTSVSLLSLNHHDGMRVKSWHVRSLAGSTMRIIVRLLEP